MSTAMTEPYYQDGQVTLYHGDFREIVPQLPPASVDFVLTDPPYPAEFLHLFDSLGAASSRILKVGGHLVTLCGHYQVIDVGNLLNQYLRFWWLCGMSHGDAVRLPGKWVSAGFKPALWYVKERRLLGDTECPKDLMPGGGKDKSRHEWGQPTGWFQHWIGRLTHKGGLVVDPCAGSGTTLWAAHMLNRRAIGVELEERHCESIARRFDQQVLDFQDGA